MTPHDDRGPVRRSPLWFLVPCLLPVAAGVITALVLGDLRIAAGVALAAAVTALCLAVVAALIEGGSNG